MTKVAQLDKLYRMVYILSGITLKIENSLFGLGNFDSVNTPAVQVVSTKFFAQNILSCIENILKTILRDAP